jgi:hypothetical protein|tara:strand:+ start:8 stop:217 length:210 start_codon:yes stop_codon:yes gene_type:complete
MTDNIKILKAVPIPYTYHLKLKIPRIRIKKLIIGALESVKTEAAEQHANVRLSITNFDFLLFITVLISK